MPCMYLVRSCSDGIPIPAEPRNDGIKHDTIQCLIRSLHYIINTTDRWFSARLQYLQCISNGDYKDPRHLDVLNRYQGVQPWALTKFRDFSLTFPWPFCGFPWPWDILLAFHYCLNTNFANNLTNHSPKVAMRTNIKKADYQNTKFDALNFHKIVHSDNLQNWILWRDKLFCDFWLYIFYYLDCTKCKFPDFSLTFPNIHFPWPSTKSPDFSLTFAKSGISLPFPWPLDTLDTCDEWGKKRFQTRLRKRIVIAYNLHAY